MAPVAGEYKLQCWGSQGGQDIYEANVAAGLGGYSIGDYKVLESNVKLYVCVGNYGDYYTTSYNNTPSTPFLTASFPGGGATHISISQGGELKDFAGHQEYILLVAGGGGSCDFDSGITGTGGYGGGEVAGDGNHSYSWPFGKGATMDGGGKTQGLTSWSGTKYQNGSFGLGGWGYAVSPSKGELNYGAQGGSGWYGGGGAIVAGSSGGGSGYVNKNSLTNAQTIAGNKKFPSVDGKTETGHSGYGACIITQIGFS